MSSGTKLKGARLNAGSVTAAVALCSGLLGTGYAPGVMADQFDTVNFTLGSNLQYDSNVFRTPDVVGPQPGFSKKSDYSTTTSAALNFDKAYSQQRFQLGANYSIRRYNTFANIDSDTYSYQGAWLWALTPNLTGSLNANRNQAQISFADNEGATQSNIRTNANQNFTVDARISGGWHLIAAVGKGESTTQQALLSSPGARTQNWEGGLRYIFTSGSTATLVHRVKSSEVTNIALSAASLTETEYRDFEDELNVSWRLSGQSSITGRLAQKWRRNQHFSQRDFSAWAGDITYSRIISGKVQMDFLASRNPSPFPAFANTVPTANYKVDQKYSWVTRWQPGAKTVVNVSLSRTLSDYQGDVLGLGGTPRSDDLRSAQLAINWGVQRYLSLNAILGRDVRTTNSLAFQYSNTSASLGAELRF